MSTQPSDAQLIGQTATHVDGDVRHGLDIIREVDSPAVSRLQASVRSQKYRTALRGQGGDGHTSGDSSSRMRAPRVSTWIALAVGSDGGVIDTRLWTLRAAGVKHVKSG